MNIENLSVHTFTLNYNNPPTIEVEQKVNKNNPTLMDCIFTIKDKDGVLKDKDLKQAELQFYVDNNFWFNVSALDPNPPSWFKVSTDPSGTELTMMVSIPTIYMDSSLTLLGGAMDLEGKTVFEYINF